MKKKTWIIVSAVGLLAWLAISPSRQETADRGRPSESSNQSAGVADQKPKSEAWRQFARTSERLETAKASPVAASSASPLRVANPFSAWRGTITGDRVKKLYELVGVEYWSATLPPSDGQTYTKGDVFRNYAFLRGADGSYDADFVAKVQDLLQRIHVARQQPEEDPSASKSSAFFDELNQLLRPVLGWTPERKGYPIPTPEFVAIVPEAREAAGFQLQNMMMSLALAQSAAERKPNPERYAQDVVRVVGGSCRINIGMEQAAALLATPLERLVTSNTPTGGQ